MFLAGATIKPIIEVAGQIPFGCFLPPVRLCSDEPQDSRDAVFTNPVCEQIRHRLTGGKWPSEAFQRSGTEGATVPRWWPTWNASLGAETLIRRFPAHRTTADLPAKADPLVA